MKLMRDIRARVIFILLAVLLIGVFFLRLAARVQTGDEVLVDQPMACEPGKRTLVVVAHGLGGSVQRLGSLLSLVKEEIDDVNVLTLRYKTGWISNSKPSALARNIEDTISQHDEKCQQKPDSEYKNIILIGYSAGGLLVRQALLLGLGEIQDKEFALSLERREPRRWTQKVSRVVLLAGMNRGWFMDDDYRKRPSGISAVEWTLAKASRPFIRLAGVSRFLLNIERGSPFVANLRLAWLRAVAASTTENFPVTVQLLGKQDEFVTREDETDMAASSGFVFISAGNATHSSILDIDQSEETKHAILEALTLSREQLRAKHLTRSPGREEDSRVQRIIFVRHGIRDDNLWASRFRKRLCEESEVTGLPCKGEASVGYEGPLLEVNINSYGYFGMLPFLFESTRQDKVREFVDNYTEEVARTANPGVAVDFVGHSNGTYVLASGLERYSSLKVRKIVFANSVVQRDYDWESKEGTQVTGPVRNYMGAGDYVVAVFPRLFEMHAFLGDLGSAGFKGFEIGAGAKGGVLLEGGHGSGIKNLNWENIADFLFSDGRKSHYNSTEDTGKLASFLWRFPLFGWALAVGVVFGLFVLVYKVTAGLSGKLPPRVRIPSRVLCAGLAVLMVLNQV